MPSTATAKARRDALRKGYPKRKKKPKPAQQGGGARTLPKRTSKKKKKNTLKEKMKDPKGQGQFAGGYDRRAQEEELGLRRKKKAY